MKRAVPFSAMLLAGILLGCSPGSKDAPAAVAPEKEKAADEKVAGPHVSREADGKVVISLSDEARRDMGIQVKKLEAVQISPELKGYGRVLDPAPLLGLLTEIASARAAYAASSNELARLKTLVSQGNTSERALQSAEAAARRDQLLGQSAQERLELGWGKTLAGEANLPAFGQALTSLETALVRIDLPLGETLASPPTGARIETLSGPIVEAEYLGPATSVDSQLQGRGFLFLVKSNHLAPGEAVTGHLKIPGEPLAGVIIPREAVVRTEGAGWIYVLQAGGGGATRIEVALDHPTAAGWFVIKGAAAADSVVVVGAEQLHSLELKGQGGE